MVRKWLLPGNSQVLVGANAEPDEAATSAAAAAKRALRLKSIVLADGVLWWVRVAKCLLRGDNIMATTLIIGLWGNFFLELSRIASPCTDVSSPASACSFSPFLVL